MLNRSVDVYILREMVDQLKIEKGRAYGERNMLVAALSKLFPASLERHQPENDDWEDDWRWVVIIDLPTGQVSWHIQDGELPMFDHLERNQGRVWDGHDTLEKYERLGKLKKPLIPPFMGVDVSLKRRAE